MDITINLDAIPDRDFYTSSDVVSGELHLNVRKRVLVSQIVISLLGIKTLLSIVGLTLIDLPRRHCVHDHIWLSGGWSTRSVARKLLSHSMIKYRWQEMISSADWILLSSSRRPEKHFLLTVYHTALRATVSQLECIFFVFELTFHSCLHA